MGEGLPEAFGSLREHVGKELRTVFRYTQEKALWLSSEFKSNLYLIPPKLVESVQTPGAEETTTVAPASLKAKIGLTAALICGGVLMIEGYSNFMNRSGSVGVAELEVLVGYLTMAFTYFAYAISKVKAPHNPELAV